jgi:hypothetical protein
MIKEDEKRLFRALITEKNRDQRNEILDNTGIPEKRLSFILIKWSGRNIWSYGVHEFGGWFEEDGFADPKNLPWLLELIGTPQRPARMIIPSFMEHSIGKTIKYQDKIVGIVLEVRPLTFDAPGYLEAVAEMFTDDLPTTLPPNISIAFH